MPPAPRLTDMLRDGPCARSAGPPAAAPAAAGVELGPSGHLCQRHELSKWEFNPKMDTAFFSPTPPPVCPDSQERDL